jgi:hypothetical protein
LAPSTQVGADMTGLIKARPRRSEDGSDLTHFEALGFEVRTLLSFQGPSAAPAGGTPRSAQACLKGDQSV